MRTIDKKLHNRVLRKNRIRSTVAGTTERPRLSVTISNMNVHAQIIDDSKQATLVAATSVGLKTVGTMTEKATLVGTEIAKKAKAKKLNKVVFDRNGRIYHGRVKALADAARAGGLEF